MAHAGWSLTRPAASFDRAQTTLADQVQKVRAGGSLAGNGTGPVTGWFEYEVEVPASGWYELHVQGSAGEVEYSIDPGTPNTAQPGWVQGGNGARNGSEKIGNFWLTAGRHTLHLQRYFWTGFPDIRAISLRQGDGSIAQSTATRLVQAASIYRAGECAELEILFGGRAQAGTLTTWVFVPGGPVRATLHTPLPASASLRSQRLKLPCAEEGLFGVGFGDADKRIEPAVLRDIGYEVIATHPNLGAAPARVQVDAIDFTKEPPDYFGGDPTRVTPAAGGAYRESGNAGWLGWQSLPNSSKALRPAPGWFAYKLRNVTPQKPHVVEVDYPDDARRSFTIALRESAPLAYPVAGGVDTGGEFSISNGMRTHSLLFWPRAGDPRVVLMNAQDGQRAAAARMRVFRLEGEPVPAALQNNGRLFANWYEEGSNFTSMYGAPDASPHGYQVAAERWARAVASAGGNTLMPTVSVYNFNLYPSRFNQAFAVRHDYDLMRRFLLAGEKYGLKVIPELNPRADELGWPYATAADPKPNLLVSKDGKTQPGLPTHYSPLFPANQNWYLGMVGELADNYAWSPALRGISLRSMQWSNPTLNNFHSLDWGYDDYTVALFVAERGIAVPLGSAGDPGRFAARYRWIMANARAAWIDWRCEKVAQLYARVVERVRRARGDLTVYTTVFDAYPSEYGSAWLREAGIDVERLNRIPGLVVINALHGYGRRFDEQVTQGTRDNLIEPAMLGAMRPTSGTGSLLAYSRYLEAIESVVPPASLGFPATTPATWTSGVSNPAGRHVLERHALAMAETDASFLGDGGNGYTLGQPLLAEFLREYRALPAAPFTRRADASDPVAVWELDQGGQHYFYAVNRERYPVNLDLRLSSGASFVPLTGGAALGTQNGVARVALQPYQLRAFVGASPARIDSASVIVAASDSDRVARQVAFLGQLDAQVRGALVPPLDAQQRADLSALASQAANALRAGHLWLARVSVENHRLLPIYTALGRVPPSLREP